MTTSSELVQVSFAGLYSWVEMVGSLSCPHPLSIHYIFHTSGYFRILVFLVFTTLSRQFLDTKQIYIYIYTHLPFASSFTSVFVCPNSNKMILTNIHENSTRHAVSLNIILQILIC